MKAYLITTRSEVRATELAEDLVTRVSQIQTSVGGYFQQVDLTESAALLMNEAGAYDEVPTINPIANTLAQAYEVGLHEDDWILGDVVLVGLNGDGESYTDVPLPTIELLGMLTPPLEDA